MQRRCTATSTGSVWSYIVAHLSCALAESRPLTKAEPATGRAIHLKHHQMPFYHVSLGEQKCRMSVMAMNCRQGSMLNACHSGCRRS